MAKSTSNSVKRIFGRKSIKTIFTLRILSFVILDFNLSILLCFKADNFIFWTLSVTCNQPCSVASKSSRCWSASDVVRCQGVFSPWSSSSSSETFTAWLALQVSATAWKLNIWKLPLELVVANLSTRHLFDQSMLSDYYQRLQNLQQWLRRFHKTK